MAKSKGKNTTKKSNKSSSKPKKTTKQDNVNLSVVGTIVFSILLAVLLYANSGEIGQRLNELLGRNNGSIKIYITYRDLCNCNKNGFKR